MTEESCFTSAIHKEAVTIQRSFCVKKKYLTFFLGDLEGAKEMYLEGLQYSKLTAGRLIGVLISRFLDGMIAFYFARKHDDEEEKWTTVGEKVMDEVRRWANSSPWNFINKLNLLEAEYYFLKGNDTKAMASYRASIRAAREHKFLHEEGLANEKMATYLLRKDKHSSALRSFVNAKNCYEQWGADNLVKRIDKAIAMIQPSCN
eukprot:scaffold1468_cov206-Alexandrium_tamarense.AAC.15